MSEVAALPARRRWAGGVRLRDGHVIYWWVEILALIVFYVVYSAIRNANQGDDAQAFQNAKQILDWQRALEDVQKITDQHVASIDDLQKKKDQELLGK